MNSEFRTEMNKVSTRFRDRSYARVAKIFFSKIKNRAQIRNWKESIVLLNSMETSTAECHIQNKDRVGIT